MSTVASTSALKVGDTLYRYDVNRRVYSKPSAGRAWGEIIYAEHFQPLKIIGETSRSWLLEHDWKASKATLSSPDARKFGGRGFFTAEQMADDIWIHEHRHKIRDMLDRASPAQLRQIAEIVGYNPKEVEGDALSAPAAPVET